MVKNESDNTVPAGKDKRHDGHFRNPCYEFTHKSGMHLQIVVLYVNGWIILCIGGKSLSTCWRRLNDVWAFIFPETDTVATHSSF